MTLRTWLAIALVLGCVAVNHASAQTASKPLSALTPAEAASYKETLEKRAQDVLDVLKLSSPEKAAHIREAVIAQYRALRQWHDENDVRLKDLDKDVAANAEAIAKVKATLKTLHDAFLARLAADLSAEQVEQVKDKLTYGTLQVTYKGYCDMLPALKEEEKTKIMDLLKQAREEAMDDGSSDEKHNTFNKYKGKINNYLSERGYDVAKASREWQDRLKQGK